MKHAPIGTITIFSDRANVRRKIIHLEQPDGTLLRVSAIQFVTRRQKFIKTSYHGDRRRRWRPFSHYVWEQETGSRVQPGYNIYHRDGDTLNDRIENLVLSKRHPFWLTMNRDPGIAKRRAQRQRTAVRRSNRRRSDELKAARNALFSAESWYVILHGVSLVLWKPCETRAAATRLSQSDALADWLSRDGHEPPESVDVLQGHEVVSLSGHDEPLEGYRRFIPDERPSARASKDNGLVEELFGNYCEEVVNASMPGK